MTSSSADLVYPVAVLREQVTALEAAMLLALADPAKRPVHRLRTTTRRIEAQLALLQYLQQVPAPLSAVRDVRDVLRRIRRAAGRVRDLDVHVELLNQYATREPGAWPGSAMSDPKIVQRLRREAEVLGGTLEERRSHRAEKLRHMLSRRRGELAPALERLMETLEGDQDLALSPARLAETTRSWFGKREKSHRVPERSEDDLHSTRKSAKMARYLAETSPQTAELARHFEAIQESGGTWHDLLTLAEAAARKLGRKSSLRKLLKGEARRARTAYLAHLKEFRGNGPRKRPGTARVRPVVAESA